MAETSKIEIPRSRKKLAAGFIVCVIGVLIGCWCIASPQSFAEDYFLLIRTLGALLILVFGFLAKYVIKWLFDKKNGLVIDADGLTNNTVAGMSGRIAWRDVADVTEWKYLNQKLVVVVLKDPHCYIDNHTETRNRKALLMNLKTCGSPVVISAAVLKISHNKLYVLLRAKYDEYLHEAQSADVSL